MKTPYWQLLKDPRWQRKRLEVLQRDNFKCSWCDSAEMELHVHHRYYIGGRKPWEYPLSAYQTVCFECHEMIKEIQNLNRIEGANLCCDFEPWLELIDAPECSLNTLRRSFKNPKAALEAFCVAASLGYINNETIMEWREKAVLEHGDHGSKLELVPMEEPK